jgi:phosphoribosylformimino-5-aminoimidazole carboxamide ribonucleotide (ProFAR) isomerase
LAGQGAPLAVPAVSLRHGAVVIVRDQSYEPVEDESGEPFAIDEFIEVFLKGFKAVLVFDIDALEGEGAQYDEVSRLAGIEAEAWWDAGARDEEDVINIITSGADKALISTRSLRSLDELGAAVELTENLIFEIVERGGEILGNARDFKGKRPGEIARAASRAGCSEFLLLDAARPLGGPIDWQGAREVAPFAAGLYLGGGIDLATAKGLQAPDKVPLKGAVVDLISVLSPYL